MVMAIKRSLIARSECTLTRSGRIGESGRLEWNQQFHAKPQSREEGKRRRTYSNCQPAAIFLFFTLRLRGLA